MNPPTSLIYSDNVWCGISNWLYRGGKVTGPPEVIDAVKKIAFNEFEQSVLTLIERILPFTILFDKIYIIGELPLSNMLVTDMKSCLGVHFLGNRDVEDISPGKEETKHILYKTFFGNKENTNIKDLYHFSGPFAGDHPDLIPVLRNIITAMRLSKKINATLSCPIDKLSLHKTIGSDIPFRTEEESIETMQEIFKIHNFPILSVDAFRNEDKSINLTEMFRRMETVRRSKYLRIFREKVQSFLVNDQCDVSKTIMSGIVHDLKATLEQNVLVKDEISKRISIAALMDVVGLFIPGLGTLKETIDINIKRKKSLEYEWRLFVFEYGETVSSLQANA